MVTDWFCNLNWQFSQPREALVKLGVSHVWMYLSMSLICCKAEVLIKFYVCCFLFISTSDCCYSTTAQSWSGSFPDRQAKFEFNEGGEKKKKKSHAVCERSCLHKLCLLSAFLWTIVGIFSSSWGSSLSYFLPLSAFKAKLNVSL